MYKLSDSQISTQAARQITILNHQTGNYYGMNEVGAHIWETLQKSPADFEMLLQSIIDKFEVDKMTCTEDLRAILTDLIDAKLVEEI